MIKVKCEFCDKIYFPDRSTQRFCCKGCSDRWWAAERRRGVEMLRNARLGDALPEPPIEGAREAEGEALGGEGR